ncbi:MAG TPA: EMC3/TMCO1 family protein [Thermoplasmata archaeon]|nr:EMC3/TMCO1 family protein [Thermoplasmata archaeon]
MAEEPEPAQEAPLPSAAPPPGGEEEAPPEPPRPPMPQFKLSTFVLTFLFVLGILMIFDTSTRTGVANVLGLALGPLIGFDRTDLLATMFCAALIEMALTALAYNWATDWVKTSRIQSWSAAFRKVQMEALRSGKKDRIAALKPHQAEITRLSSELSISQLKGMAVTWFLVIAIYTWVGLFIAGDSVAQKTVSLGGSMVNIGLSFQLGPFPIPIWIVLFSLYTFPLSYVLRRGLKHYSLRRYELRHLTDTPPTGPAA